MTTTSSTNQGIDQATEEQGTKSRAEWGQSFDLSALLNRNRVFSEHFQAGDLPMRPKMATIFLTCVDSRVDPAHLLGLELGDAIVIRNAGGRITPAVMKDLAILGVLGANVPGAVPMQPELVVIHHTDCGMSRMAVPAIQEQVAKKLGISIDEVAAMAITDPAISVRDDIERLRNTPGTPNQLVVSGFVYDVKSGGVKQIVPPAPLRIKN